MEGMTSRHWLGEQESLDDRLSVLALFVSVVFSILLERRLLSTSETGWAATFLTLIMFGIVIAVIANRQVAAIVPFQHRATSPDSWSMRTIVTAGVAILCALASGTLVSHNEWAAQWFWLAGMAIPLLVVIAPKLWALRTFKFDSPSFDRAGAGAVVGLFVASLALRVPRLTSTIPFVHGDEATCGLIGRLFDQGKISLLHLPMWGLPTLGFATSGLGLRLFGDNIVGLRLTNCIIGSLGVVLTYLLGKEWFGRRTGVLAAVLLGVSFLQSDLSRDGIHYIQGPTLITLNLLLVTLWLTRGSTIWALVAGLSLPLALQVYFSARVAIVPLAVIAGYLLVNNRRFLADRWREVLWFALGLFVALIPIVALFGTDPTSFNGHQAAVSILDRSIDMRNHLTSEYGTASLPTVIRDQIWRTITTFNVRGDSSEQIGWSGPMFDWLTAAFVIPALLLAMLRWKRWQYGVCLAWFWAVVGAVVLTADPPWWPRLSALLPAVILLVAALVNAIWVSLERAFGTRMPAVALTAVLLGVITFLNLQTEFNDYPSAVQQHGTMGPTLVGNFLASHAQARHTAFISDGSFSLLYEPIRFLAPQADGCTILPNQPWSTCPTIAETQVFILLPGAVGNLSRLQRTYPHGKVVSIGTTESGAARYLAFFPRA